jgi:hypothetical protein
MSEPLYFYGVDGTDGSYLVPPVEPEPERPPQPEARPGRRMRSFDPNDPRFTRAARRPRSWRGWKQGVEPEDLGSAGWAAIFACDADPRLVEALQPLLDLRRTQASAKKEQRFKLCTGAGDNPGGHRPSETALRFLERHKTGQDLADPDRFPYHVLIVGDPRRIPFSFQYELDSMYSVGRVCFDTLDEYAAYARSVVAAEPRAGGSEPPRVAFFATEHVGDEATRKSAQHLAHELAQALAEPGSGCDVRTYRGAAATKSTALRLLGGALKPSLLFTATHGLAFERHDPRHALHQGALLCQDSPGPALLRRGDPLPPEHYVQADDIDANADVAGLIAFFFGCYTAGTPARGGVLSAHLREPVLALNEFPARLPQRLLAHPRGGALAVIGHVDQAWSTSFWSQRAGPQIATFETVVRQIAKGYRVGRALEALGQRLGQLGTALEGERDRGAPPARLEDLLTMHMDARNYVLLGDPAVRLPPSPPPPPPPPKRPRRLRGFDPAALH